ncbi:methyltransferase [Psychrobacter sp. 72-O-c]|uniref:methyltransferase n=1 Tax=Psychrobacter sp. 72-O-c TaxID=2774125 RepID=UPI001918D82A|nr:methyltransferase [Psychrobacter sp. 72-O-c]
MQTDNKDNHNQVTAALTDHNSQAPDLVEPVGERTDRSFDTIADHFEKKVYGGLKGEIRLAVLRRDIFEYTQQMSKYFGRPLRILDVGAGLAQIAIDLAAQGHQVVVNDISENMLAKAKANFEKQKAAANIDTFNTRAFGEMTWHVCPYQQLEEKLNPENSSVDKTNSDKSTKFDLILCHALLEWLAEPAAIMDFFDRQLTDNGALSLCFYNPVSYEYRNLIMGNFNLLDNTEYQSDNKISLTPNHPVAKQQVESWLQHHHYNIVLTSGLRVFHDYTPLKRGGNTDPEAVIRMELRYSQQEPYKWLGRYLHILATR